MLAVQSWLTRSGQAATQRGCSPSQLSISQPSLSFTPNLLTLLTVLEEMEEVEEVMVLSSQVRAGQQAILSSCIDCRKVCWAGCCGEAAGSEALAASSS